MYDGWGRDAATGAKLYGVCRVQFHSARKTRLRTADRSVSSVDRARAPESVIVRDTTRAGEAGGGGCAR